MLVAGEIGHGGRMELKVDRDLCEANAVCCGLAPEVFELDDDEQLIIKVPNPGDELQAKVQKAVERCPKNALALS
jgi:ferredoxin